MYTKTTNSTKTQTLLKAQTLLFHIACGCHSLLGRVAYASHSVIFIGPSYSHASYIWFHLNVHLFPLGV